MNSVATSTHNVSSLPFRGGVYVASLMAELSRLGISERIKQARKESGLTQQELADGLHVHKNTVANWERPSQKITPWDRLEEIAGWLGVSRNWLIHGEEAPEISPPVELLQATADAVRALQVSQESALERLDEALALLRRLADGQSASAEPLQ